MYRELTGQGVRVPNGFAVTAEAFREILTTAGAWDELHALLDGLDKRHVRRLALRQLIVSFIAAGIVAGASVLGVTRSHETIELLAELGVP